MQSCSKERNISTLAVMMVCPTNRTLQHRGVRSESRQSITTQHLGLAKCVNTVESIANHETALQLSRVLLVTLGDDTLSFDGTAQNPILLY